MTTAKVASAKSGPEWWRGAAFYQIYPRSFRDSNGDGVGDLQGVIDGLDYVARLGVDGVWLSPFYASPMRDFGYDIADYCDVDPIFGTLGDFDRLIDKARALKLKIIIDQVYSHTSDAHPWFAESRSDQDNPKADWYVWANPKSDGSPPNNWQSVFGGPAWTWDARRRQYYFHNFLSSQPDLNLHNKAVQDAMLGVARFWLDRGVDGFRLDALNFLMHDPMLRDNPPAPRQARAPTRPFDYQIHQYSMSHPDIVRFIERLRCVMDEYDAIFSVAEVVGADALGEMKAFTEGEDRLTSAYNFDFLYASNLTAPALRKSLQSWTGEPGEGWPSWAFSNHDAPRAVSRWAADADRERAAKLFAMLLLSLRGDAFLYQGEELGLPQAVVPFESLKDPEAIANWPLTLGRDGARTPLPWRRGAPNAGFTSGRPWLPVDPRHDALAIDAQEECGASTLQFVRRLLHFRRDNTVIRTGALRFIEAPAGIAAFQRDLADEALVCVFNLTDREIDFAPREPFGAIAIATDPSIERGGDATAKLAPYSGFIARRR